MVVFNHNDKGNYKSTNLFQSPDKSIGVHDLFFSTNNRINHILVPLAFRFHQMDYVEYLLLIHLFILQFSYRLFANNNNLPMH